MYIVEFDLNYYSVVSYKDLKCYFFIKIYDWFYINNTIVNRKTYYLSKKRFKGIKNKRNINYKYIKTDVIIRKEQMF